MKKNDTPKIANLIVDKEDFKNEIVKRIALGKELLSINVPLSPKNPYLAYGGVEPNGQRNDPSFKKLKEEYKKWDDYNCELLKRSFSIPNNEYFNSYATNSHILVWASREDPASTYKKVIEDDITFLESLINKLTLIPSDIEENQKVKAIEPTIKENKPQSLDVFIVHGHDDAMKTKVESVLSKLKLNPIILHKQADGGRTIIEKLEGESSDSGFAVFLLTADDIGNVKTSNEMNPRARQNVLFEMGYFIGKLGRNRVMALIEEGVEQPGDLSGVVYTKIDREEAWSLKLVKELRAAGYKVDANDLI